MTPAQTLADIMERAIAKALNIEDLPAKPPVEDEADFHEVFLGMGST
jgi:hypothetical protein